MSELVFARGGRGELSVPGGLGLVDNNSGWGVGTWGGTHQWGNVGVCSTCEENGWGNGEWGQMQWGRDTDSQCDPPLPHACGWGNPVAPWGILVWGNCAHLLNYVCNELIFGRVEGMGNSGLQIHYAKVGDTAPVPCQLVNASGPIDLTNACNVTFSLRDTKLKDDDTAHPFVRYALPPDSVYDAVNGRVMLPLLPIINARPGDYVAEFTVTFSDGSTLTAPNDAFVYWRVGRRTDAIK